MDGVTPLNSNDHRTKLAFQDAADAPLRQGEDGVGLVLVDHRVLGRLADLGVLRLHASVLDEGVETRAGLELGLGRVGVGLIGKQDLLQIALLGRAKLGIFSGKLLIGGLGVGVAHFRSIGDRVRLERQNGHLPVFGGAIARLAIVVEGFQDVHGGRGNVAHRRSWQKKRVRRPCLALIIGFRDHFCLRRGDPGGQRADNELSQHLLAQFRDEAALVHIHVPEGRREEIRIEGAGLVVEVRIRGDNLAQSFVRNAKAELRRLLVDRRFVHQLLQDAAIKADLSRLLIGEGAPEPPLILLDRPIVGDVIVLGGDFLPPN